DLNQLVALAVAVQLRKALTFHAHHVAALGAARDLDLFAAAQCRDFNLCAQSRLRETDRQLKVHVRPGTLEQRMRADVDVAQQIAGRAALLTGFALAGHAQGHAFFDAGGDFDGDLALFHFAPGTAAAGAGLSDDLAAAVAARARRAHGKE